MALAALAGPSDFFRSSKLVRSRIEISPQTDASNLVSCARADETERDEDDDQTASGDVEDWE
jgi:hypothetical protein